METDFFKEIITSNKETLKTIENARKVAVSNISAIITGTSGVGKALLANCIHKSSKYNEKPLLTIDCPNLQENLISILSNTENSCVYFDEIDCLHINEQKNLIMFFKSNDFSKKNLKFFFSTNKNLIKLIQEKQFLKELYNKISELTLNLLPLREKKEDIPLLIEYFIDTFNLEFNKKIETLSNIVESQLLNYEWPGNIRELKNTIKTAVFLCNKNTLWLEDIPLTISFTNKNLLTDDSFESIFSLKHAEKNHLTNILNMCKWNKSKAAKLLEISRPRLDRKILEYSLKKI